VFLCYYALTFYGDEWYIGNMDVIIEFSQSAFKHSITDADIRWAFDNVLYDEQLDESDGGADINSKHLLIGFDRNANTSY